MLARLLLALSAVALVACGPARPSSAWPGAVCDARLGTIAAPESDTPHLDPPISRVLVDVRVDALAIERELAERIPVRLADRRGVSLGAAGIASFTLDRGPFTIGLDGDAGFVAVDVDARASFCKPLGPLGCVEWASCRPAAHVAAAVPLVLDRSYRFGGSRVTVRATRPCTLTALSIDVTDEILRNARREADVARQTIDRSLPDVEPVAAVVWRTLGTSVPIGLHACARAAPIAVVEGAPHEVEHAPAVPIGVEGHVVVESPCRAADRSPPMPPPRFDRSLAPGVDLRVPIVVSWEEASRAATGSVALAEPRAGKEVIHFDELRLSPGAGSTVSVRAEIAGRVCGELAFSAALAMAGDTIGLVSVAPADGERARVAGIAPTLDVDAVAEVIGDRVRIPLPIDASSVPKRLDRVAEALFETRDPKAPIVDVTTESAAIESVEAVAEGIAAVMRARGTATVTIRSGG